MLKDKLEPEEVIAELVGWTLLDDLLTGYCGKVAVCVEEGADWLLNIWDCPVADDCGDTMPDIWGRP